MASEIETKLITDDGDIWQGFDSLEYIKQASALIKKQRSLFIFSMLSFFIINLLTWYHTAFFSPLSLIMAESEKLYIIPLISLTLVLIIRSYFEAGYIKIMFGVISGRATGIEELFTGGYRFYFRYVILNVIIGLILLAGTLLLLAPGIYFAVRLQFAPLILIDDDCSVFASIKRSWELSEGIFPQLFNVSFVLFLYGAVGILLFVIGAYFTFPDSLLGFTLLYKDVKKRKYPEKSSQKEALEPVPSYAKEDYGQHSLYTDEQSQAVYAATDSEKIKQNPPSFVFDITDIIKQSWELFKNNAVNVLTPVLATSLCRLIFIGFDLYLYLKRKIFHNLCFLSSG
jgi:hypothetical protein